MDLHKYAFAFPETITNAPYLLATYYMELNATDNVVEKVMAVANGQTLGTWTTVPGITSEMLTNYMGKVISYYDIPPAELNGDLPKETRTFVVQIAYPEANFGPQFPMLLTTLLGNDVSTSAQLKLLDIQVSPSLAAAFAGPRFGIEGIRNLTGVYGRPIILNVLKPCTGFSPEVAIPWIEDSARGGSDVIKDDELLSNPSFNSINTRIKLYHQALDKIFQETGRRTLYCVNITDRADRMMENAQHAVELGADMIMLNALAVGLGSVQAVAAIPGMNLPILTHFATFASITEGRSSGISSSLFLGKMLRLAGADAASFPSPFSVYPLLKEKFIRTAQYMRMPLYDIKPTLPVPGGGIHPATAVSIVKEIGCDIMLTVGGAIQGHPNGSTAGAKAMIAAMESVKEGISLEEKAKASPELKVAIEKWGSI